MWEPELELAAVERIAERLASRLSLARLPREATGELLAALFGVERVSDELVGVLYRETEGNPFFVEEVVRHIDGGLESALPESVKDLLLRRLRRLDESARQAL